MIVVTAPESTAAQASAPAGYYGMTELAGEQARRQSEPRAGSAREAIHFAETLAEVQHLRKRSCWRSISTHPDSFRLRVVLEGE